MKDISTALTGLGVKGGAQKVFTYLLEHGVSPVTAIAEAILTPKSSIYDSLEELSSLGLIIEYSENRSKEYGTISSEQLKDLIESKVKYIKSAQDALLEFMKSSDKKKGPVKPKVKFYVGSEGIRQAFRDTMWHEKCKKTYLMWPTEEMVEILTPEFSKWHSEQRLKHSVMMYVIRKHSDRQMNKKKSPLLESAGWKNDREVRYAPKDDSWSMSYWIYDDKCLFASGAGEQFAFVVHSKEFADLMLLLWKKMWETSN
jgi:sugar-specific transcriptional regulator TrmB